jgi:hypothetical protein
MSIYKREPVQAAEEQAAVTAALEEQSSESKRRSKEVRLFLVSILLAKGLHCCVSFLLP